MEVYKYGDDQASIVLIQMVGEHDLSEIEQEIHEIQKLTEMKFQFIAIKVNSWNHDLSPWNASAVFGSEGFGDGAEYTLKEVLQLCTDSNKTYCIGGYSMAGLFALWAACKTNRFAAISISFTFNLVSWILELHETTKDSKQLHLPKLRK